MPKHENSEGVLLRADGAEHARIPVPHDVDAVVYEGETYWLRTSEVQRTFSVERAGVEPKPGFITHRRFFQARVPVLAFSVGGCSERGQRTTQEDALRFAPEHGVFVVADGLGDGGGGDVAADAAVSCAVHLAVGREAWSAERLAAQLASEADTAVRKAQSQHWGRCQTTLALLVLRGDLAAVAWCGDSRVYRLRDGTLEQLTQDHRYGRHVLAKCLGARDTEDSTSEVRTLDLRAGDAFALVTDGVGDTLPEERIRARLAGCWLPGSVPPAQRGAIDLVMESLELGSRDNCTALVVFVGGTP